MSGSAVLPPKRPPRSPLKLQLPGAAPPTPPASERSPPQLSLAPASTAAPPPPPPPANKPGRPSLKLPDVTKGLGGLSLAIPTKGPSHYSSALNGPDESESEFDDDDDASHRPWAVGEQERMAGELLDVINGPAGGDELEEELSGATRRPRSNSRVASRKPSFNAEVLKAAAATKMGDHLSPPLTGQGGFVTTPPGGPPTSSPKMNLYGDHVQAVLRESPHPSPRLPLAVPTGYASGYESSGLSGTEDEGDDDALDISPATIEDRGRLGEGASGEVRKVLHKPTGLIMAKKVRLSFALTPSGVHLLTLPLEPDDHDLAESQAPQAALARAPLHAGLHASAHRAVLRRFPRSGAFLLFPDSTRCPLTFRACTEQLADRYLHGVLRGREPRATVQEGQGARVPDGREGAGQDRRVGACVLAPSLLKAR